MPLIVASDAFGAAEALAVLTFEARGTSGLPPAVLLHEVGAANARLADTLRRGVPALSELIEVEVGSARFSRLNFGALALVVLDLSPALLDSAAGRRLADALGGLLREGLTLLLVGEAAAMAGALLPPAAEVAGRAEDSPLRAGLALLPSAMVLPALESQPDLRALLLRLTAQSGRLLALEAPAAVICAVTGAHAHFRMLGSGSALLVAFAQSSADAPPTVRLHPLQNGQEADWPA